MWCGVLFCVQVRVAGRGVIGTSPLARHDGSGINAGKRVIPLPALRGFSNRINHRLLFPPSHPFVEMPLNASPTAEIAVVYLIHAKSASQARWIWVIVTHYSPPCSDLAAAEKYQNDWAWSQGRGPSTMESLTARYYSDAISNRGCRQIYQRLCTA